MPETSGRRRDRILGLLAAGDYSLSALIAAADPGQPEAVLRAVRRLEAGGAVVVSGRASPRRLAGAVARLAEAPIRAEAEARRPAGTTSEAVEAWQMFLR